MKQRKAYWLRITGAIMLSATLVACSGAENPLRGTALPTSPSSNSQADPGNERVAGTAEEGAKLFTESIGGMPSCSTCHALDNSRIVGPGLAGVANRAGERVSGETADEYLHNSIVNPGAYIVEGYENVMPPVYAQLLSEEQVSDLVAYLLTLE